jgi:uncharacterized protein YggE
MKKILTILTILILCLSVVACSTSPTLQPTDYRRVINVAGQGKVIVVPDVAYITVGVLTENVDVAIAQDENTTKSNAIIDAVKKLGVDAKDIKTVSYYISPKYEYTPDKGNSVIIGYIVSHNIQFTVNDMKSIGAVIEASVDNGANVANGVSFGLKDYEAAYQKALANAVKVAADRAKTLADSLGVKIKGVVSVNESGGYYPIYRGATDAKEGSPVVNIEMGTIEITSNVSIVYDLA